MTEFPDLGYAGIQALFLGLFDVTLHSRVAVGTAWTLFDTVRHCFDLTTVLY